MLIHKNEIFKNSIYIAKKPFEVCLSCPCRQIMFVNVINDTPPRLLRSQSFIGVIRFIYIIVSKIFILNEKRD